VSRGPIRIDVRPAVRVDADDLERLMRAYHEWVPSDPDIILALDLAEDIVSVFEHCRCGWQGDQADHGSHVDYHVRQALAGRIEFP